MRIPHFADAFPGQRQAPMDSDDHEVRAITFAGQPCGCG
jgi:hypothetical protein